MTNSPPENDAPLTLRAATQMSAPPAQAPAPVTAAAARTEPAQAGRLETGLGGEDLTVATLAMSGMVVLASGWLVRRRRLLAQPPQEPAAEAAAPQEQGEVAPAQPAVEPEPRPEPELLAEAAPEPEPEPVAEPQAEMEQAATELAHAQEDGPADWAPDPDIAFNPSWAAATAPMPRRPSRLALATQKRLIKWLMWVRTVAGGAAILAAIAVVVFWTIETTDRRAGETGLTMPLLVGALAGWALSWGAGQLANMLHRMFFNRVHPKFDT